jgi:ribonuclease BN (tRNA processing enzyme)
VNVTLAPSAIAPDGNTAFGIGSAATERYLSTYIINDAVAVDAGCLGLWGSPDRQARIQHVFLSHTHIDHIASLPIFLENIFDADGPGPVTIHASAAVLEVLQKDLFNDRLWPDFIALSRRGPALLKLSAFTPGKPIAVEGLRITPVPVNHIVPTCGFILEDERAAVVITSDTGPTEEIWERANAQPRLKAVFLEATFPNDLADLAAAARHLTPAAFAVEARKLKKPVRLIAVHIKARYHARIVQELEALELPGLEIARYGIGYDF